MLKLSKLRTYKGLKYYPKELIRNQFGLWIRHKVIILGNLYNHDYMPGYIPED